MSGRRLRLALVFCLAAMPVGMAGAAAFNPDDGWLLRSMPLWQAFGLYAYFGMLGGWALAAYFAVLLLQRRRPERVD